MVDTFLIYYRNDETPDIDIGRQWVAMQVRMFSLKGSEHYWKLLKIIISIKTYLVTNNGELLIV